MEITSTRHSILITAYSKGIIPPDDRLLVLSMGQDLEILNEACAELFPVYVFFLAMPSLYSMVSPKLGVALPCSSVRSCSTCFTSYRFLPPPLSQSCQARITEYTHVLYIGFPLPFGRITVVHHLFQIIVCHSATPLAYYIGLPMGVSVSKPVVVWNEAKRSIAHNSSLKMHLRVCSETMKGIKLPPS